MRKPKRLRSADGGCLYVITPESVSRLYFHMKVGMKSLARPECSLRNGFSIALYHSAQAGAWICYSFQTLLGEMSLIRCAHWP